MTETLASIAAPLQPLPPGVYDELPAEHYHADPALSASGMKLMLDPGCPALYRYQRDHPPKPKDTFDFGHAFHRLMLGDGARLRVLDYDNWLTKDAKAASATPTPKAPSPS